jgi:hypothetical protein
MIRNILFFIIAAMALPSLAQQTLEQFPKYTDFSIPCPDYSTEITIDDLELTDNYLDCYPDGLFIVSNKELHALYKFYKDDSDGMESWRELQRQAVQVISSWDIRGFVGAEAAVLSSFGSSRYVYTLSTLKNLSIVYVFTGNQLLSTFIRSHLVKMAGLPYEFWVHAELRGYNSKHPAGALETAGLNKMLCYAIPAVKRDMTDAEFEMIETAWREKGHVTTYNWLEHFSPNNWTAVISCGLLHSATYFDDDKGRKRALAGLKYYIDRTIEPDGSYSEGYGYFAYPIGELFNSALLMTPAEIQELFGSANLRESMTWRIYGHIFDVGEDGTPGYIRISYGDNGYGNEAASEDKPSLLAKYIYHDGIASWIRKKYKSRNSFDGVLFAAKFNNAVVAPISPSEAGLPNVRAFDSGDLFIRDGWSDEGIVLGMKFGDLGSRVEYSHARPELHSIAFAAFGEYFIVTPGSASYRSRIYNEYDICTRASNTITIDGMNQKSPRNPSYKEGRWDNRQVWVKGYPHAALMKLEHMQDGGAIVRSEANNAYHIDMKEASRTIRFIPEGGFFIISDVMNPNDGKEHMYDYRLHFFNRDEKTVVSGNSQAVKVQRPTADLYIAVTGNAEMELHRNDGYMHAPFGRDYDENGPRQGKLGSAIELDWKAKTNRFAVTTVLYPKRSGDKAPAIRISEREVVVDGKTFPIP